jgi:hypothetical protein
VQKLPFPERFVNSNLNDMQIPADEIVYSNTVGKLGNKILRAVGTCGGLHLIEARSPDGSKQVIGAGSHRAVARMIAKKMYPEVEWTVLEKSAEIDPRDVEDLLPFWEEVVTRAQKKLS